MKRMLEKGESCEGRLHGLAMGWWEEGKVREWWEVVLCRIWQLIGTCKDHPLHSLSPVHGILGRSFKLRKILLRQLYVFSIELIAYLSTT